MKADLLPRSNLNTRCVRRCRICTLSLLVSAMIFSAGVSGFAALVFGENVGSPTSTTTVPSYTGWQNNGVLTFSGTADVRTTIASSGYSGASGAGNVYLAATKDFAIGSINTVGYSGLILSFGAFKSTTTSDMSELQLSYSIDGGVNYSPLSIPTQSTGPGTAIWRLITLSGSLPLAAEGISDLRLKWVNSSSTAAFRLDDFTLAGAPIPEPSTFIAGALLALPFGVQGIRYLRNRKRA